METKHITTRAVLKADGDEGSIEAVFSTFGIVDRDGDIVEAGAVLNEQPVPMVWSHDWTKIIGKGVTSVDAERAIFKGSFFTQTTAGRDAYETVKAMGDLQEYSWGFRINDADYAERDGQTVRIIKSAELFEVSPVLVGAGRGTGTLSLKHQSFTDEAEAALSVVQGFVLRARDRKEYRAKDNRPPTTASRERLATIATGLLEAADHLKAICEPGSTDIDVDALLAEFMAVAARQNGVSLT